MYVKTISLPAAALRATERNRCIDVRVRQIVRDAFADEERRVVVRNPAAGIAPSRVCALKSIGTNSTCGGSAPRRRATALFFSA